MVKNSIDGSRGGEGEGANAADVILRALCSLGGRANMLELVHETVDEREDGSVARLTREDFEAGVRYLRRLGILFVSKAA